MEVLNRFVKAVEYLKSKADDGTNEGVSRLLRYSAENYISDVIGGSKPINKQLLKRMVEYSINGDWVLTGKGSMLIDNPKGITHYIPKAMLIEIKTASGKLIQVKPDAQTDIPLLNAFLEERDRVINELQTDKEKLQNTIDTNLTALMQLLGALSRHDRAFHDTILKSLARLEGKKEVDLIGEARSSEAAKQIEEMKGYSNNETRM